MTMPNHKTTVLAGGLLKMRHFENDQVLSLFKSHITHRYDLWPLFSFIGIWAVGFVGIVYWSMMKPEVQINRKNKYKVVEWERSKDIFGKNYVLFGKYSELKGRIPELDQVENELLKAKQAAKSKH